MVELLKNLIFQHTDDTCDQSVTPDIFILYDPLNNLFSGYLFQLILGKLEHSFQRGTPIFHNFELTNFKAT